MRWRRLVDKPLSTQPPRFMKEMRRFGQKSPARRFIFERRLQPPRPIDAPRRACF
jgi:hypothetical protein